MCSSGWHYTRDSCYIVSETTVSSHAAAVAACQDEQSKLATLTMEADMEAILRAPQFRSMDGIVREYYIGLSYNEEMGIWHWDDEVPGGTMVHQASYKCIMKKNHRKH